MRRKTKVICAAYFILYFIVSCGRSQTYKELKIKLSKIVPSTYDEIEIWLRDEDGKTIYFSEINSLPQHEISLEAIPKRIQVMIRMKKNGLYVMEGISPFVSPDKLSELEILIIPTSKAVIFPIIEKNISRDTWIYPYELSDKLYIFTENGEIFEMSYTSWKTEKVGSFTPRKRFSISEINLEGKDSLLIIGGEKDGEKSKVVEVFRADEGTFRVRDLVHKRAEAKTIKWDESIIVIGGDDEGYCEAIVQEERYPFPCGVTDDFSLAVISQKKGLLKVFIYHRQKGEYEILYIMRDRNTFEVSLREKIPGIKRKEGEVVKQGDKILVFGGYNNEGDVKECETYDPQSHSMVIKGYYEPRVNFSVVNVDGNTFIIGGRRKDGTPFPDIDIMRDCAFEKTDKTLSFPPKPRGCAYSLFKSYITLLCQGNVPEIFPIASLLIRR